MSKGNFGRSKKPQTNQNTNENTAGTEEPKEERSDDATKDKEKERSDDATKDKEKERSDDTAKNRAKSESEFNEFLEDFDLFFSFFQKNDAYIKKTYATQNDLKRENLILKIDMLNIFCKSNAEEAEKCDQLKEPFMQKLRCLGDDTLPGCHGHHDD